MSISFIIPVYNIAHYLRRCVFSIFAQRYDDYEIILVDDGSTDDSGNICDEIKAIYTDKHIKVLHKTNGGLSDARNAGLQLAEGEYVAFIDGDDYYANNSSIPNLIAALSENNHPDLLLFCRKDFYADTFLSTCESAYDTAEIKRIMDTDGAQQVFAYLTAQQRFNMSACFQLIKRKVLTDNNITFIKGLRNEDIDWSIQLWRVVKTVGAVNEYAYIYNHRSQSITTTTSIEDIRSYHFMFSKWLKQLDPTNNNDIIYLQYLAYIYPSILYIYYSINKQYRAEARELIKQLDDILTYSSTKKSNRVVKVRRILGFRLTLLLFGLYGQYGKQIKNKLNR